MFHKGIQGNLEGESSSLSDITWGFLSGTPSFVLIVHVCSSVLYKVNDDDI